MAIYELEQRVFYDAAVAADVSETTDDPGPDSAHDADNGEDSDAATTPDEESSASNTPAADDSSADYYKELIAQYEDKLNGGDQSAQDEFGNSVSINGDYAVVAAAGQSEGKGAVYVFTKTGDAWVMTQKLTASDGEAGDNFGSSVFIDGDYIVVGASGDDDGGADAGAAYIFTNKGGSWIEQTKIDAGADSASGDAFGSAVAMDGDFLVVGAYGDDDFGEDSGSAYVFEREGDNWYEQSKLTAGDGEAFAYFGWSVDIDGDSLVVGAIGDNGQGAAYVFDLYGSTWMEDAKLTASDGETGDMFGWDVDIQNDEVLVGAVGDDDLGTDSGAAYLFNGKSPAWEQSMKLTASTGGAYDYYGSSVDLEGSYMLVGAQGHDEGTGAVFLYKREASGLKEIYITAGDGEPGDHFGSSADLDGEYVIIGAPGNDEFGTDSGAAYALQYTRPAEPPTPPPDPGEGTDINDNTDIGDNDMDDQPDDNIPGQDDGDGSTGDTTGPTTDGDSGETGDGGYSFGDVTPPDSADQIVIQEGANVSYFDAQTMDTSYQMPNGEYMVDIDTAGTEDIVEHEAEIGFDREVDNEGAETPEAAEMVDDSIVMAETEAAESAREVVDDLIDSDDDSHDQPDEQDHGPGPQGESGHAPQGQGGEGTDEPPSEEFTNALNRLFLSDSSLLTDGSFDGEAGPAAEGEGGTHSGIGADNPAFQDAIDRSLDAMLSF